MLTQVLKISQSMALARFQVEPVLKLVTKLTKNISKPAIQSSLGKYMLDTQMGSSLVELGKGFITSDYSPLGLFYQLLILNLIKKILNLFILNSFYLFRIFLAMVSRNLAMSGIQLSQISILTEIQKLASFLLDDIPDTVTAISGSRLYLFGFT